MLTEAFFWSSKDGKQFKERFGDLAASPHLPFCTEMNQQLIEAYMPKAIIAPGLGLAEVCRPIYGLKFEDRLVCDKGRLAECYTDGIRPWVFTKHWTASFGFSNNQRSAVRDYIRSTWLPAEV